MENKTNMNPEVKNETTPPRHWVSLEELTPDYWNNAEEQTRRGQEFYFKPVETLEAIEKSDKDGVSRRDFLTVMGASMAMASFACARRPVNKIIPYVVQPQEVTPGVPLYYASTSDCGKYGILVKTREGRPIKIEGNEEHPVNKGSLNTRGQASVLSLYDPDRLKGPQKGAAGISWAEFDKETLAALQTAKRVRLVSGPKTGPSVRRAVKEFLSAFPDGQWIEVDPSNSGEVEAGQEASFGTHVFPTYYFEQAEVVLSVGADFLNAWGDELENSARWAKRRKLLKKTDEFSKLFVAEGMLSVTGSNADLRLPLLSGGEAAFLAAVAQELIVNQKKTKYAVNTDVTNALKAVSMEQLLAKAGGVSKDQVKKLANELYEARGKSIVVGGGSAVVQTLVNLLNSALENEGKTVDASDSIESNSRLNRLASLAAELESIDAVIFWNVNPVYFMPNSAKFVEGLKKVKTVISFASSVDETALASNYIGALSHSLESWGDAKPRNSVVSLQQPTIAPLYNTRSFEEQILAWSKQGLKAGGLAGSTSSGNFYDYVKENWKQSLFAANGKGQTFLDFWENTLQKGVLLTGTPAKKSREFRVRDFASVKTELESIPTSAVTQMKSGPVTEASGVMMELYEKTSMGNGSMANNAWLQEMPDPITTITWDNYLNVGVTLAKELGLETNDVVKVKAGDVVVEVPVNVQPGLNKGTVALAVGYGRTAAGKIGTGVGANAYKFASLDVERGLKTRGIAVSVIKTGKKYQLASTQKHNQTEGRPVVNDITYDQYKKDSTAAVHSDPHLRLKEVPSMWTPPFDYAKQPYRWGMAIDVNACTGCGACIIACQAENNIPVVGRDRVRMGRQMHWIKIDRYYSGDADQPSVLFQPMMCQHCENAPCETVCPVVATSHSEDGLNQMTYSRCVGTRYCQNNCPYKVRRFNFFDHWKDYKDAANMAWNPEVTVRSRGIMEKCSFCVQRINVAKSTAKDKGTKIKDADLKTACQQTCSTDAIVFGNINDPESEVSKLQKNDRAYRVLEILNVKPVVSYLTKIRNVEGGAHGKNEHNEHKEGAEHGHS